MLIEMFNFVQLCILDLAWNVALNWTVAKYLISIKKLVQKCLWKNNVYNLKMESRLKAQKVVSILSAGFVII